MTLTQATVEIPLDRRINLNFEAPRELPTGSTAQFEVIWFPKKEEKPEKKALPKGKIGMTRKELEEHLKNAHTPLSDSLLGIIPGMSDLTDEELDAIRYEALAEKHLK